MKQSLQSCSTSHDHSEMDRRKGWRTQCSSKEKKRKERKGNERGKERNVAEPSNDHFEIEILTKGIKWRKEKRQMQRNSHRG